MDLVILIRIIVKLFNNSDMAKEMFYIQYKHFIYGKSIIN